MQHQSVPDQPIYVTQPHLPSLEDFIPLLQEIWNRKILTNGGPFHQELEQALCEYLGVEHLTLFANGTIALVTALKALRITGEVITTPYSFVATAHALLWNDITPVFVDINPQTLNLDSKKIEAAITPRTAAILPVHCYGTPCDVDAIQGIADAYNFKVIYDAAHAFGVRCHCGSLLNHGDLSVLSFHATKVFNTFEGGAIICHDDKTKQHIDYLKNFGFVNETTVVATGINGKMNEMQAALGLLQLKSIDTAIDKRRAIDGLYRDIIEPIEGLHCLQSSAALRHNYGYFPILVSERYPLTRDGLYKKLKDNNVYSRRYFYPLITEFSMYRGMPSAKAEGLPVANRMARQVICLPIYPELAPRDLEKIAALLLPSNS
jgi:dTDP-4-amino-4,6-dideoxygalactose transaminase